MKVKYEDRQKQKVIAITTDSIGMLVICSMLPVQCICNVLHQHFQC